jgi:hypothetical protein
MLHTPTAGISKAALRLREFRFVGKMTTGADAVRTRMPMPEGRGMPAISLIIANLGTRGVAPSLITVAMVASSASRVDGSD